MRRALFVGIAVLALGSCNNDSDSKGTASSTSRATSTTTAPTESPSSVPLSSVNVALTKIADVSAPTAMATRKGDASIYVAEQAGRVVAVNGEQTATVLDISDHVNAGGERGLLGMTFSPDGSKLYVHYSDPDGNTQIDEYAVTAEGVDSGSRRAVFSQAQPQANHNGGQIAFGPDGLLYLGLGDGGAGGDQGAGHAAEGNGQSSDTVLGKIIRIDPAGDPYVIPADNPFADRGGRGEIWSYGLRNPWRFSFDRKTGDLWIGDVGQNAWEEVDFVAAPDAGKGVNFGWPNLEGTHPYRRDPLDDAVAPVAEHSHDDGWCSVIGGYVYRGKAIPALHGAYLYTDYCASTVRALRLVDGVVTENVELPLITTNVQSFGQDADGELYLLTTSDGLFRIDPSVTAGPASG